MKRWKVPCVWQMMGYLEVEASTAEEAWKAAEKEADNCALPLDNASYLEETFELDQEGEPIEISADEERYPMPDPTISMKDMEEYGYNYEGMLPLNEARALELISEGLPIYLLYNDNTESMVDIDAEIITHQGICGIERSSWKQYLRTRRK